MGLVDQYTKEIRKQLSYSATWKPGVPLSVGDVAMFEKDRQIHPMGTLEEYGIPFSVKATNPNDFKYTSKGAVSIKVKAAGQAPLPGVNIVQAEAGVSVKFGRENAILFHTRDVKLNIISNMDKVGKKITEKYKAKEWDKKYFVITQCVEAGGTTIIIASSKNSQIDFTASGDLNVANLNLADLSLNLETTNSSDLGLEYKAEKNSTPLFEAWGFNRRFIRRKLGPLHVAIKPEKPKNEKAKVLVDEFCRVDYDNYFPPRPLPFQTA